MQRRKFHSYMETFRRTGPPAIAALAICPGIW